MRKTKIILSGLLGVLFYSSPAQAELGISMGGKFSTSAFYSPDAKLMSQHRSSMAISSGGGVWAKIQNESDPVKYGAVVYLRLTSKNSGSDLSNGSNIFFESNAGKIQVGSPPAADIVMRCGPVEEAVYDGGCTAISVSALNAEKVYGADPGDYSYYLGQWKSDGTEPARNLTYYSPTFGGLQIGVTYVPDSTNGGGHSFGTNSAGGKREVKYHTKVGTETKIASYEVVEGATDLVSAAVNYKFDLGENTKIKFGLTGAMGNAIQMRTADKAENDSSITAKELTGDHKLADVRYWDVGFAVYNGPFWFSAAYGDLGKSLSSAICDGTRRNSSLHSVGVGYNQNRIGVSATYLHTNSRENKVNTFSLETSYILGKGCKLYFGAYHIRGDLKPYSVATKTDPIKRNVTAFMLGVGVGI